LLGTKKLGIKGSLPEVLTMAYAEEVAGAGAVLASSLSSSAAARGEAIAASSSSDKGEAIRESDEAI
jgi:hypothetical protein